MPESDQRGKDEVETPAAIRHMQRRARSRKGSNQRLRWSSRIQLDPLAGEVHHVAADDGVVDGQYHGHSSHADGHPSHPGRLEQLQAFLLREDLQASVNEHLVSGGFAVRHHLTVTTLYMP